MAWANVCIVVATVQPEADMAAKAAHMRCCKGDSLLESDCTKLLKCSTSLPCLTLLHTLLGGQCGLLSLACHA